MSCLETSQFFLPHFFPDASIKSRYILEQDPVETAQKFLEQIKNQSISSKQTTDLNIFCYYSVWTATNVWFCSVAKTGKVQPAAN